MHKLYGVGSRACFRAPVAKPLVAVQQGEAPGPRKLHPGQNSSWNQLKISTLLNYVQLDWTRFQLGPTGICCSLVKKYTSYHLHPVFINLPIFPILEWLWKSMKLPKTKELSNPEIFQRYFSAFSVLNLLPIMSTEIHLNHPKWFFA